MKDPESNEDRQAIERSLALLLLIALAVILALFLGPCDPPPGEPVPAASGEGPSE